jgi:hypothetical protein
MVEAGQARDRKTPRRTMVRSVSGGVSGGVSGQRGRHEAGRVFGREVAPYSQWFSGGTRP